jgi:hypothetical protein
MPVLKNAREEKFAQARAAGKSADASYKIAGYKANRSNAARLNAKEHIGARVTELQQKQVERTIEHAAIDTRGEMHELRRIISLAIQNGDLNTALKGQMFLLTCFGYADLPTLTHDHMTDRAHSTAAAPPTAERQGEVAQKNILQFGRVQRELERLAGPRVIEHEPRK